MLLSLGLWTMLSTASTVNKSAIIFDDCDMSGGVEWEAEFHQPLAHWYWEVW